MKNLIMINNVMLLNQKLLVIEGAIKFLKHSRCIVLGFTAEVEDETIKNTNLI